MTQALEFLSNSFRGKLYRKRNLLCSKSWFLLGTRSGLGSLPRRGGTCRGTAGKDAGRLSASAHIYSWHSFSTPTDYFFFKVFKLKHIHTELPAWEPHGVIISKPRGTDEPLQYHFLS